MLNIHFDLDLSDKQQLGIALAVFNAIGQFAINADSQQAGAVRQRKPKGNSGQAPQAAPSDGIGEPELPMGMPQQMPPQQMPGTLGGQPQAQVDVLKGRLHSELRDFSTVCGPMALQGLLAYFGAQRASDLSIHRAEEILQYIHAARAQQQQMPGA
jgi:hypothetical protein